MLRPSIPHFPFITCGAPQRHSCCSLHNSCKAMEKERKRIAEMCRTQKCLSVFGTRTSTGDTGDRHWYPHAQKGPSKPRVPRVPCNDLCSSMTAKQVLDLCPKGDSEATVLNNAHTHTHISLAYVFGLPVGPLKRA